MKNTKDFKHLYREEKEIAKQSFLKIKELELINEELLQKNKLLTKQIKKERLGFSKFEEKFRETQSEIEEELEIARSIQISLLPKALPDILHIKASAIYMPAGRVGGDLYDIVLTPSKKIAFLIFDVSGHGVPAALIATMAKMLFSRYIEKSLTPAEIFKEVNEQICNFIKTEHYLTAFLGILDPLNNSMVYSRAGHVKPLLYRKETKEIEQLGGRGFFIGHSALRNIVNYKNETVKLDSGDRILFYTDGLTEGYNSDMEFYGIDRLSSAVKKFSDQAVEPFLTSILKDQIEFRNGAELHDDFTMLCIENNNPDKIFEDSGFTYVDKPIIIKFNSFEEIDPVCGKILRAMDDNGFSDTEIKRMRICLYEILINAFDHGNGQNKNKHVTVMYKIEDKNIKVSVIDEGKGFDYRNLPDPLSKENLTKEHGRGIYIVKKYMDSVLFNKSGNRITITKQHVKE